MTEPTDTSAKQVWYVGDPEPLDVPALVDREGDTWINLEPNSWYEKRTGRYSACSWSSMLEYAPLRRPEQPTAATLLAASREG